MQVAVAYNTPDQQLWLELDVPEGSTVGDVIDRSGLLGRFPSIDLNTQKVGIFGKFTKLDAPVSDGDRVEIYRAITADPKTVPRRARDDDDDDDDD